MDSIHENSGNGKVRGYPLNGNAVIQNMVGVNLTGNVIPPIWYRKIRFPSGKPDPIAVTLLADIVYWHRPIEERDETSGQVIGYRKKFKADKLQRSYGAFAEQFGFTKIQVRNALERLEELGLIDRDFRTFVSNGTKLANVLSSV
jgi:hypothetical protein